MAKQIKTYTIYIYSFCCFQAILGGRSQTTLTRGGIYEDGFGDVNSTEIFPYNRNSFTNVTCVGQ